MREIVIMVVVVMITLLLLLLLLPLLLPLLLLLLLILDFFPTIHNSSLFISWLFPRSIVVFTSHVG